MQPSLINVAVTVTASPTSSLATDADNSREAAWVSQASVGVRTGVGGSVGGRSTGGVVTGVESALAVSAEGAGAGVGVGAGVHAPTMSPRMATAVTCRVINAISPSSTRESTKLRRTPLRVDLPPDPSDDLRQLIDIF
jgi:hypothetical protein